MTDCNPFIADRFCLPATAEQPPGAAAHRVSRRDVHRAVREYGARHQRRDRAARVDASRAGRSRHRAAPERGDRRRHSHVLSGTLRQRGVPAYGDVARQHLGARPAARLSSRAGRRRQRDVRVRGRRSSSTCPRAFRSRPICRTSRAQWIFRRRMRSPRIRISRASICIASGTTDRRSRRARHGSSSRRPAARRPAPRSPTWRSRRATG